MFASFVYFSGGIEKIRHFFGVESRNFVDIFLCVLVQAEESNSVKIIPQMMN